MVGWDLLKGHSYIDSIIPVLKKDYQELMEKKYNSTIIFYDMNYDGKVMETNNKNYGYFRFIGSFKYYIE